MKREPFSLNGFWQELGNLYATVLVLFGAPLEIARLLILTRKKRRDLLAWLGPMEALARRLLLIKALSLPPANCAPVWKPQGNLVCAYTDKPAPKPDMEDASAWRVRFSVWPYGATRRSRAATPLPADRGGAITHNALPLARRLEALRRLLENPQPALARLTRLLAARRETAARAFAPYRPPALAVQSMLEPTQDALEAALNTS